MHIKLLYVLSIFFQKDCSNLYIHQQYMKRIFVLEA